ncbi:MAG TPA: hypothetical protein PL009_11865 [Flavipsychrobacter sp.]|nr:hypothetical protein [Flavipsychrobacter sp.]
MKFATFFIAIAALVTTESFAQQPTVKRYTTPLAGSVVLSEVEDKYNAQVYSFGVHAPDASAEKKKLQAIKKQMETQFPRKRTINKFKTTAALPPVVAMGYVADTNVGIPPDNDVAVSKGNKSVSVVNSYIATHDATTGQMTNRKSLKPFSAIVGLNSIQHDYRYDPKVIYDPQADKFICVMLNANTSDRNWIVVGFSKTNDPSGAWNFYKFFGNFDNDTTWFDYPAVAITSNEFFLTGNKIMDNTSWQAGFKKTVIYQINKQDGYNGASTLDYQIWDNIAYNGKNIRNLYPVKGGGNIYGPEQYFLSNRNFDPQNDTVFLVKLPDTIGSFNNTLTITPLVSNITYGVPPDGRQKDTFVLATNDARILGAYREGSEIQFVSTSVHPASGSAAVYHGKISNFASTPSLQASLFGIDTLDFGYPNLSFAGNYNGQNHSIISFNYTGAQTNAGVGAIYYDGTHHSDMVKVKQGDSSIAVAQNPVKQQRWGDYMGSQPDWNTTGIVWIEGIYGKMDKEYGNWIAKLVSPFYLSVPTTGKPTAPSKVYPNPAYEFIRLEFQMAQNTVVDFSIFDVGGRKVDHILSHYCKQGTNLIQMNIGSLSPATYFVKGIDQNGNEVMAKQFVKH